MSYTDRNGKTHETVRSLMEAHGFHFEPQMGGGCTAYSFIKDGEEHYLVTVADGGMAPTEFDDPCLVGHYADADDEGSYTDATNIAEAIALVRYGDRAARV